MSELASKKCVPCKGGVPPLKGDELQALHGQLGVGGALVALVLMLPVLLAAAWVWRTAKQRAPHEAQLVLIFLTTWFVYELLTRPW